MQRLGFDASATFGIFYVWSILFFSGMVLCFRNRRQRTYFHLILEVGKIKMMTGITYVNHKDDVTMSIMKNGGDRTPNIKAVVESCGGKLLCCCGLIG